MATQHHNESNSVIWRLAPYIDLLAAFVESGMDPSRFGRAFVEQYVVDPTVWADEEAATLDKLLGAIEDFDADPELRAELDVTVDAEDLRSTATFALDRLRALSARQALRQSREAPLQ